MAGRQSETLYSTKMLALAASLANFPLSGPFDVTAEARSRTCGSTISLGLTLRNDGRVGRIGMQVSACAVGQSSAAIMASAIEGKSLDDLATALEQIERWLGGTGELPDWPGFEILAPALPHTGRHEALRLPWRAALQALSTSMPNR